MDIRYYNNGVIFVWNVRKAAANCQSYGLKKGARLAGCFVNAGCK
jgi:hypothetical protein